MNSAWMCVNTQNSQNGENHSPKRKPFDEIVVMKQYAMDGIDYHLQSLRMNLCQGRGQGGGEKRWEQPD